MKTITLVLMTVVVVSGCANLQPPKERAAHYFCKPDSAIRYRGRANAEAVVIRPADKTGSCRYQ